MKLLRLAHFYKSTLTSRKSPTAVAVSEGCGSRFSTLASHAHPHGRLCRCGDCGLMGRGGVWTMAA